MPVLRRVNTLLQRSCPASRVDCCALVGVALDGLPIHEERDSILSLGDAIVWRRGRNPRRSTGYNASGDSNSLEEPTADIDVVG